MLNDQKEEVVISEEDVTENDFSPEELDDNTTDWKAKALELKGLNKRRATQLKKAKDALTKPPVVPPKEEPKESSELDYSQKAFLLAKGIEEFDLVLEEAKKFGGSLKNLKLEDLIGNPYFKQRLETLRTTKANEIAADGKNNRSGTGAGRTSVDYWLAKGEHPPKELGAELAQKYVEAKRNQGKNAKQFYND